MAQPPLIIAHRGASAYLPEHSLAAKALAFGMGADSLEQDLVLSRDGHLLVLHDIYLDTVTDVATRFPDRARDDQRYYALDFSLEEIKQLHLSARFDRKTGEPVSRGRFPVGPTSFQVPTFEEELQMIAGLRASTGRSVAIYPEIKAPGWHRSQGVDIARKVVETLSQHGYRSKEDLVFLQCFDPVETRRLREELQCGVKLIQLVGKDAPDQPALYGPMVTPDGLERVAEYADGIGPSLAHLVTGDAPESRTITSLVALAHARGLVVHPYTVAADALPPWARSHDDLLDVLADAKVDGFFTDFTDLAVQWRDRR